MSRHNIWIPADLWAAVQKLALRDGVREGRPISVSEWIRESIRQRLEQDAA